MQRLTRWALILGVCAGVSAQALAAEQEIEVLKVEVGDRSFRALCTQGERRAILLHGEEDGAESWRPVLRVLASRGVGACAYDRTGTSSGSVLEERGWFELLDELRRVHGALGVEAGYTLVGHSVGGMYARLFASDRPRDVGGLVLVDPSHEDMPDEARPGLPAAAWSAWMERRRTPNSDGIREADLAAHARGARPQGIPITVITATEREAGPGWDVRFVAQAARRVHASLLRGASRGRHIPAQGSGHRVHVEDPVLVAGEIETMVRSTSWRGR